MDEDTEEDDDEPLFADWRPTAQSSLALNAFSRARSYIMGMGTASFESTAGDDNKPAPAASRRHVRWVAAGTLLAFLVAATALGLVAFSIGAGKHNTACSCGDDAIGSSSSSSSNTATADATAMTDMATRVRALETVVATLQTQLAKVLAKETVTPAEMAAATSTFMPPMLRNLLATCEARRYKGDLLGDHTLTVAAQGGVMCEATPIPAKIIAADGDDFGYSVAAGPGGVVVVGARYDDNGTTPLQLGSASVYHVNTTADGRPVPRLLAKLLPEDGAWDDQFGCAVAVGDDNVVVVGAWHNSGVAWKSGAAYLYRVNVTSTNPVTLLAKLVPYDGVASLFFGWSVAAGGGGLVAVGTYGNSNNANGINTGAVYLYTVNATTGMPHLVTKLLAKDGKTGDGFGVSVAIGSRGILAVGAWGVDKGNFNALGSVYVYSFYNTRLGDEPYLIAELAPEHDEDRVFFGNAVAVSANLLVVGAMESGDRGKSSGSAYVYRLYYEDDDDPYEPEPGPGERMPPDVMFEAHLVPTDGAAWDYFGYSVAAGADGIVVIGAKQSDDLGSNSGSAYIFRVGAWDANPRLPPQFVTKLVPPDGAVNDNFGNSVAANADGLVVVGAHLADTLNGGNAVRDAGSVYVYQQA